jgi:hypothetical protein
MAPITCSGDSSARAFLKRAPGVVVSAMELSA